MGIAELAARRSTCFRGNVGAVIISNNRDPVSIGYNGPPSGEPHCQGNGCSLGPTGGCVRSVHAEINALDRMELRVGQGPFDLYVTSNPCPDCANAIVDSGLIQRVYYQSPYRIKTGIGVLLDAQIEVFRLSPSGYLVNERTQEVLEAN
jgi:dCMP deaminase